ncbi:MAG: HD domain-containing protein [Deltaproteobacteria bacterium]|nr:HD domain-containing protein [Deltaproteobacteria bacterium]
MVPSRSWSLKLIKQKQMPEHILHHSVMVCEVALVIARAYCKAGGEVNIDLVEASAILHDICKIDTINSGGDHALMGRLLLEEYGYPKVGRIVGQHVRLNNCILDEALIVNYADKRVMHDRVVLLSERFADLLKRYGTDDIKIARIIDLFNKAKQAEQLIVRETALVPKDLNRLNLVAGNDSFDGENCFLREYRTIEEEN